MSAIRVAAREAAFDVGDELARLDALGGGGVASFTGVVRGDDGLVALRLETHAGMAERALARIAAEAAARWDLLGLTLIHRHGRLAVGERIVIVATAAHHRGPALAACAFLIDWTKTRAPYWKQECFADGRTRWVEPRQADAAQAESWVR